MCPLGVFLKTLCTFLQHGWGGDKNIIAANLERPEYLSDTPSGMLLQSIKAESDQKIIIHPATELVKKVVKPSQLQCLT